MVSAANSLAPLLVEEQPLLGSRARVLQAVLGSDPLVPVRCLLGSQSASGALSLPVLHAVLQAPWARVFQAVLQGPLVSVFQAVLQGPSASVPRAVLGSQHAGCLPWFPGCTSPPCSPWHTPPSPAP